MDIWTTALISSLLLAGAIALMFAHVRSLRSFELQPHDAGELIFRRRQFRLRMQCSVLLAVLAVGLVVGDLVNARVEPLWVKLVYWGGMTLVVVWMGLSAMADMMATKHYYGRQQDANLIEQTRLKAELRRLRAKEGNGKPDKE